MIADRYATDRGRSVGVAETLALPGDAPKRLWILDVGSGNGVPMMRLLVNGVYRAVGLGESSNNDKLASFGQ